MAFERDHQAALEEFPRYLADKLREISLVDFIFNHDPSPARAMVPGTECNGAGGWQTYGHGNWGKQRMCPPGWDRPDWKHWIR